MEDIPSKDSPVDRTRFIYSTGSLEDVTFVIRYNENPEKRFKAHKHILSISSPVFRAMFNWSLAEQDEVTVIDILPDAFEALLRYLYTDKVVIKDFSAAMHLNYAGKKYLLPILEKRSNEYLFNTHLDPDEACAVFEDAVKLRKSAAILNCLQTFEDETVEVMEGSSFLTAHPSTVEVIAQREKLELKIEYELFNGIRRWAELECKRLNKEWNGQNFKIVTKSILPHVRFLTMSAEEIVTILETKLFTPEEMNPILYRIFKSNSTIPYNDSFSSVVEKRSKEDHSVFLFRSSGSLKCVKSVSDIPSHVGSNYMHKKRVGPSDSYLKEYDIISFQLKMLKGSLFIYKMHFLTSSPISDWKEVQSSLRNVSSNHEDSKNITKIDSPFLFLSLIVDPILLSQGEVLDVKLICKALKEPDFFLISDTDPVTVNLSKNEEFTLTPKLGCYCFPFKYLTVYYTPYFY